MVTVWGRSVTAWNQERERGRQAKPERRLSGGGINVYEIRENMHKIARLWHHSASKTDGRRHEEAVRDLDPKGICIMLWLITSSGVFL
jgi:hypothetical protein